MAERLPYFDSQAVLVALLAGWVTGAVWYLLADGAYKAATKGIGGETRAPRTQIRAAIAQVVMTIMLAMVIERFGQTSLQAGVSTAIMMWFGFVMTTMIVNHSHLGAPISLTIVDGIHWLLVLIVMGAIIGTLSTSEPQTAPSAETAPTSSAPMTSEPDATAEPAPDGALEDTSDDTSDASSTAEDGSTAPSGESSGEGAPDTNTSSEGN